MRAWRLYWVAQPPRALFPTAVRSAVPPITPSRACRAGSSSSWSLSHLSWGRQLRIAAIALEPAHHVKLCPHPVRRFDLCRTVILLIEAQHRRGNAAVLERLVELFALRNGRAPVQLPRHDQGRCLDVAHMHQRGLLEPIGRVLPERLFEETVGEERYVGLPGHADPVDDRATDRGGCEAIRMSDHPAR